MPKVMLDAGVNANGNQYQRPYMKREKEKTHTAEQKDDSNKCHESAQCYTAAFMIATMAREAWIDLLKVLRCHSIRILLMMTQK